MEQNGITSSLMVVRTSVIPWIVHTDLLAVACSLQRFVFRGAASQWPFLSRENFNL